ncbi:MAG: chromosome partition protein Smc [Bacteroidota bacterium]|jgi:uncharacterized phage infection (PIP) family protein YhgE
MQTIPPSSAKKIQFSATIYDTSNTLIPNMSLVIQYFDTQTNKWEPLLKSTTENGLLSAVFDFSPSPSKATILAAKINQIIAAGSMPTFRLISAVSLKLPVTELFATTSNLALNPEKTMFLAEFGEMIYNAEARMEKLPAKETVICVTLPVIVYKLIMQNKDMAKQLELQTQKVSDLTTQLKAPNQELQKRDATIKTLNDAILQEAQKTTDLQTRLTAKDEIIATKNQQILEKDKKIAEQTTQIITAAQPTENTRQNTAQPMNKVYAHILDEVHTVAARDTNNRYALSSVSMNLKTFVEQDANGNMKLQLIDSKNAEKINGASVSEVKLEVATNNQPAMPNTGKIPSILGLTESAVRSVLQSIGLQLNPVYQSTELSATDKYSIGQAFKQSPIGGDSIGKTQTVTVIFAKSSNEFN